MGDTVTASTADGGAWALSRLGFAIDSYVDRQINNPQNLAGNQQYGIDANGNVYQLGAASVYQTVAPARGAVNNNTLLLLLIVGAVVMMGKA